MSTKFLRIQLFTPAISGVVGRGFLNVHKSVFLFHNRIVPDMVLRNVNSCHNLFRDELLLSRVSHVASVIF